MLVFISDMRSWGNFGMLEVLDLACSRGEHQLFSGLNFALLNGELMQVEGANGSGKTTLLRTLCGLMQADSGEIRWHGKSTRDLEDDFYSEVLYLGHHNAIKDELSAIENLRINCALSGNEISETAAIAALRRLGLRGRETFPVRMLSQGQRRRVALARLLMTNATLWILDEPLTALDVKAVELIQEIIADHVNKTGMVIFTTHQPLVVPGVNTRFLALT